MSLPITAVGPLNVLTNPILMESAAIAEFASASDVIPASQSAALIFIFLLVIVMQPVDRASPFGERRLRPRGFSSGDALFLCATWQVGGKHEPPAPLRTFGALHP